MDSEENYYLNEDRTPIFTTELNYAHNDEATALDSEIDPIAHVIGLSDMSLRLIDLSKSNYTKNNSHTEMRLYLCLFFPL